MNTDIALHEKMEHFAKYVSLLSGEFNVQINVGEKTPGTLTLPNLENLDEEAIDFLYALCLREVGTIVRTKRTVSDLTSFSSINQALVALVIDDARVERYLSRKFGGAGEILLRHWSDEAHRPRFSQIAFGFDPHTATVEQTLAYACKWHLLGRPKFHWDRLFPLWAEAMSYLNHQDMQAILDRKMLSWEDARTAGVDLLKTYYLLSGSTDTSGEMKKKKTHQAWEEAAKLLSETLPKEYAAQQKKIDDLQKKIDEKKAELAEKMAATNISQMREDLRVLRQHIKPFNHLAHHFKNIERLTRQKEKHEGRLENFEAKEERLTESFEQSKEKIEEATRERMEKLTENYQEKIDAMQQRLDELQQTMDALAQQKAEGGLSEKKEAALDQKIEKMMEKIEQQTQAVADKNAELQQRIEHLTQKQEQKINEKSQSVAERLSKMEEAQGPAMDAAEKEIAQIEKAMAQTQEQIKKDMKDSGMSPSSMNLDDVMAQQQAYHEQMGQKMAEIAKAEAPFAADMNKIQAMQEKIANDAKKAAWEIEKQCREMEKNLQKKGVDVKLSEEREIMEGWDEANKAQESFDHKLEEHYMMSVVNGRGGGKGDRDVMLMLEEKMAGIEAIDPNDIFEGIAKLSPMAGFSESGVVDGDHGQNKKASHSTTGLTSNVRHTVWSRAYDRVLPAVKNGRAVAHLKRSYQKEIKAVEDVFRKKMRPSFKPKFRGGREEGDLDARAIWKLAANQDSDFYEDTIKKPEKKSAASIVVDLSGSMASWGENAEERIQALTLMLSSGLSAVAVDHEIIGFCAPQEAALTHHKIPSSFNRKTCRLDAYVAKSFQDKGVDGIGGLVLQQADNSDGEAVRLALSRLKRRPAKNKIMFLIGDGKPFMQDAETDILDDDLRQALMEAAQEKTVVISLGFNADHVVLGDQHIALTDLAGVAKAIEQRIP